MVKKLELYGNSVEERWVKQPFGSLHVAVMHKRRSGSGSLSRAGLQCLICCLFLVAFFGSRRWWWLGRWRKWIEIL